MKTVLIFQTNEVCDLLRVQCLPLVSRGPRQKGPSIVELVQRSDLWCPPSTKPGPSEQIRCQNVLLLTCDHHQSTYLFWALISSTLKLGLIITNLKDHSDWKAIKHFSIKKKNLAHKTVFPHPSKENTVILFYFFISHFEEYRWPYFISFHKDCCKDFQTGVPKLQVIF